MTPRLAVQKLGEQLASQRTPKFLVDSQDLKLKYHKLSNPVVLYIPLFPEFPWVRVLTTNQVVICCLCEGAPTAMLLLPPPLQQLTLCMRLANNHATKTLSLGCS